MFPTVGDLFTFTGTLAWLYTDQDVHVASIKRGDLVVITSHKAMRESFHPGRTYPRTYLIKVGTGEIGFVQLWPTAFERLA